MHYNPSMSGFDRSLINVPFGPENVPPLGHAIRTGDTAAVKLLLELGAEPYFKMPDGRVFNAVAEAVFWARGTALDMLLESGAGTAVNKPSFRGPTCLAIAVHSRYERFIKVLIKTGAFINAPVMEKGMTPLQYAAFNGNSSLSAELVAHGASLNDINPVTGLSAMHAIVKMCDSKTVAVAIAAGGDIHQRTAGGETPLMLAAARYGHETAAMLLRHGAKADEKSQNPARETALHIAARQGNANTAVALLDGGANPLLTDAFNITASKRAVTGHSRELPRILEQAERKAEQAFFDKAWRDIKNKKGRRP